MATASITYLLKGRPDAGREDPQYLAGMVDVLSWLTPEEHGWLTHPRDGLHTVCKFLPTPADVHEFLAKRKARAEQFRPAPTSYHKFDDDPNAAWNKETDVERKKRVVRELLGYNPGAKPERTRQYPLAPPTTAELDAVFAGLKSPPGPITPQLRSLLIEQGGCGKLAGNPRRGDDGPFDGS